MIGNDEINDNLSDNNTIIINDNCIPDENEINYQLTLYKINKEFQEKKKKEEEEKNLTKNQTIDFEINFDEICKNNPAIYALISSQKNDNSINLISDIITLIKTNEKYKNFPNDKLSQKLVLYIQSLKKKNSLEITDIKINDIKKNITKDNDVNQILSLIPECQPSINVYDRLYNKRKKFQLEINETKSEKNDSFLKVHIPTKTLEYLNKLSTNETYIRNKTPKNIKIKKIKIKLNNKSNSILYNKYKTQFENTIEELNKNIQIKYLDRLSYDEFLLVMKKIGFIREKHYENEIILANKIFNILSNNYKTNIIPTNNLFIFTLSILNLYSCYKDDKTIFNQNNKRSISISSTSSSSTSVLSRNKGQLLFKFTTLKINSLQSKKIFQEFMSLNFNWKNNLVDNSNNIKNEHSETKILKNSFSGKNIKIKKNKINKPYLNLNIPTYHPITNVKYNQNIKGNLFTHIAQNKNRKILNNAAYYKERERIEKSECTFKPTIIKYNPYHHPIQSKYNKSFISNTQSVKTNDEIEFENNFKEYTFKPDISLSKNSSQKYYSFKRRKSNNSSIINSSNSFQNDENEKKYIERLEKGRKEREKIRNKKMLRNYSYDCFKKIPISHELNYYKNKIKFDDSMRNEKGIKPLFVLDINLNDNQKKRIFIYKGDNVEEIVIKFVDENNIDGKYIKFIKNLIMKEMKKFN